MDRKKLDEQLTLQIIDRAQRKDYSKFDYIRNIAGAAFVFNYFKSAIKLKNGFIEVSNRIFSEYCSAVKTGVQSVEKLMTYLKLVECQKFYDVEKLTAKKMLLEYCNYLFSGHLIDALMGNDRDIEN